MIFDDVLDLAKKVSKYTIAGEGNVSIRDGDTMLIKASGSTLETMTDEDLVRCNLDGNALDCLLYTSPSPRDWTISRMPSSA